MLFITQIHLKVDMLVGFTPLITHGEDLVALESMKVLMMLFLIPSELEPLELEIVL